MNEYLDEFNKLPTYVQNLDVEIAMKIKFYYS